MRWLTTLLRRSGRTPSVVVLAVAVSVVACGVKGKVKEEVADLVGIEEYIYGFPHVMMDVTREVVTATACTREYQAPINQFGRIRTYVNPDFKDVVRISYESTGTSRSEVGEAHRC